MFSSHSVQKIFLKLKPVRRWRSLNFEGWIIAMKTSHEPAMNKRTWVVLLPILLKKLNLQPQVLVQWPINYSRILENSETIKGPWNIQEMYASECFVRFQFFNEKIKFSIVRYFQFLMFQDSLSDF